MISKALASVAAGATLAGVAALMTPVAASAAYYGCEYPRICFYKTEGDFNRSQPTAAYQDITGSWQILGTRSRGAYWVQSTRRDDGTLLHFTNGHTVCIGPGTGSELPSQYGTVDKIKIMDSPTCRGEADTS
jgi:hypothetical protein